MSFSHWGYISLYFYLWSPVIWATNQPGDSQVGYIVGRQLGRHVLLNWATRVDVEFFCISQVFLKCISIDLNWWPAWWAVRFSSNLSTCFVLLIFALCYWFCWLIKSSIDWLIDWCYLGIVSVRDPLWWFCRPLDPTPMSPSRPTFCCPVGCRPVGLSPRFHSVKVPMYTLPFTFARY